jgi:hypothetical protein
MPEAGETTVLASGPSCFRGAPKLPWSRLLGFDRAICPNPLPPLASLLARSVLDGQFSERAAGLHIPLLRREGGQSQQGQWKDHHANRPGFDVSQNLPESGVFFVGPPLSKHEPGAVLRLATNAAALFKLTPLPKARPKLCNLGDRLAGDEVAHDVRQARRLRLSYSAFSMARAEIGRWGALSPKPDIRAAYKAPGFLGCFLSSAHSRNCVPRNAK